MSRPNPLLLVASLLLATGCSAPVSHAYTTQGTTTLPPAPTSTSPEVVVAQAPAAPEEALVITGAGFDLHTAGTVSKAAFDAAWSGVLDTLNRYLEEAVLTPLRSGGPAGDLRPLFTSLSVAQVMTVGDDRAAFIDEGLAPASDLHKDAAVATLTALAGADGTMSVVAANLELRLSGHVDGAPMFLDRTGELVLMPEGGTWRIDAWDLKVTRRLAQSTTSTTARS
ncbi:MAG: hypothetical protein M3326_15565 [Actinomycetota bacterium]|nr:hypothetical protein [Actinomycetota bacterium]